LKYAAEFAHELTDDWDEGSGIAAAGVALLHWQLKTDDRTGVEATWARLLSRDDLTETLWSNTVQVLTEAGLPELTVQAHARLSRITPLNYVRTFDWIRALQAIGRDAEALLVLDGLSHRAILNDEIAAQCASLYAELHQPARARELFALAVAGDPSARSYKVYLDFARLLLAQGDVNGARQRLRTAFRNPVNREFSEVIAFLESTGRLGQFDQEIAGFELRPEMLVAARRALFAHFEKAGRIAPAVALVDEHPEIMEAGLSARLRALAEAAKAYDKVGALLERIIAQSPLESIEPTAELAALYGEWAADELAAGLEEDALKHLQRSHELRTDLFAPMQRLAELLAKRGDPAAAARVVQDFLTTSKNVAEKERAQQILARIEQ
jgi:tetratricopeptide (TPR) repeat protein